MKRPSKTTGAVSGHPLAVAARARLRRRLQRVITPRDTTALDAEDQARAALPSVRPFEALDPVMQARTDMAGTLAVVDALLDADKLTEAAVETMRRHIAADWDRLVATTDRAWDLLVKGRGDK